jgi:hypothetical protein
LSGFSLLSSALKHVPLPAARTNTNAARYVQRMVVDLQISQIDVDVMLGVLILDSARVEFATNFSVNGRRIELSQLHLHGGGANILGPRALRDAMQALMVWFDVDEIVIDGGSRVTGAATGPAGTGPRTPKRLHFKRDLP